MLEMLAGAGLNFASRAGAEALTLPRKEAARERLAGKEARIRGYLPMVGPGAEGEAAGKLMEDITGRSLPKLAIGTEVTAPTGAQLTAPPSMNIADLAKDYIPGKTISSFIKPTPTLEQLKTRTALDMTPEERKLGFYPKEQSLEAARMNLLANIASREGVSAENRASREAIAAGNQDIRLILGQLAEEGRQQQRGFLQTYMTDKLNEMKRRGTTQEEQRELSQAIALQNQIGLATGDQKKTLQQQMNTIIDATKNPILQTFPKYMEDVAIPGTGYFGTNIGATKRKVPVGTSITPEPTSGNPPSSYLSDYKLALSTNASNPEAIKTIKARAKARYPDYNWGD